MGWPVVSRSMTSHPSFPADGSRPRPSWARSSQSGPRCGAKAMTRCRPRWWCAITARRIPKLADDPPGRVKTAEPVPIEDVVSPRAEDQTAAAADGGWAERPTCSTASSVPAASGCGPSASTAGATRSRHGARTSPPSSTRARAKASCPTTCSSAPGYWSAPRRARPASTAIPSSTPRRGCGHPATRSPAPAPPCQPK